MYPALFNLIFESDTASQYVNLTLMLRTFIVHLMLIYGIYIHFLVHCFKWFKVNCVYSGPFKFVGVTENDHVARMSERKGC